MPATVGKFVLISGLASDTGRSMNGKIEIARSIHFDTGRVGVEVLGKNGGTPESYAVAVGIKELNLEVVRNGDGYKLIDGYLGKKANASKDKRVRLNAIQERFNIPGFVTDGGNNATMCALLQINGRFKESLLFTFECFQEIPPYNTGTNAPFYDRVASLMQDEQLQEALNVILQINSLEEYHQHIKIEMLLDICTSCCEARDDIKVPALRELINIYSKLPDSVETRRKFAQELGDALCRQTSFEEGIKLYKQANASGINASRLMHSLVIALHPSHHFVMDQRVHFLSSLNSY